jgi:hypothetical protein
VTVKLGFEGLNQDLHRVVSTALCEVFGPGNGLVFEAFGVRESGCDLILVRENGLSDLKQVRTLRGEALLVSLVLQGEGAPEGFLSGEMDDALVLPVRLVDFLSLLRRRGLHQSLRDFSVLQDQVVRAVDRLQEDVELAERLQKGMLPRRFTDIRGFQIRNRYLAGLRGGDWFDIAEARDGSALHFVLSDGSSSGLSSGVGAALTRVAMRVSLEGARSPLETVRALNDELQLVFTDKHRLSILYGIVGRAELSFRYLALGASRFYHAHKGDAFRELEAQGELLKKGAGLPEGLKIGELSLSPEDRILMLSDGFIDGCGGSEGVLRILNSGKTEGDEILNDLGWQVRKGLADDELPAQECSALWWEVESRVIRLAR